MMFSKISYTSSAEIETLLVVTYDGFCCDGFHIHSFFYAGASKLDLKSCVHVLSGFFLHILALCLGRYFASEDIYLPWKIERC